MRNLSLQARDNRFTIHVATVNGSGSQTANTTILRASLLDVPEPELGVHGAAALPDDDLRPPDGCFREPPQLPTGVPDDDPLQRDPHRGRRVPPQMLVRKEEDLTALAKRPLEDSACIRRRADRAAALSAMK